MKPVVRVVEKMVLQKIGARMICDVNTCSIVCESMSRVADVVTEFTMGTELRVVSVEERFVTQPLASGWREFIVLFTLGKTRVWKFHEPKLTPTLFKFCDD